MLSAGMFSAVRLITTATTLALGTDGIATEITVVSILLNEKELLVEI